ncbi:Protein BIG GRAIN 1-like A [Quillaja saponaria]|uniref:Protein BIG GRAIN 1-like A n=1 Tax=Quillaja saponaria TaxID=32244 RepID=A0AAD7LY80_QUISA|nr:Protein BIG GRAIN 1-like A [Quillaja saponaria]
MSWREKTLRDGRFRNDAKNPSFSSSLLDKIYQSIDEGDKRSGELKFYRETMGKKQSRSGGKCNRAVEEEEIATENLRRAFLLEKWMDKKVKEKVSSERRQYPKELDRKSKRDYDQDQDGLFFSSTSSSSDSSSGGFSSSDTESMCGVRSGTSCFAPPRPKPIRTSVSAGSVRSEKTERKHSNLFHKQRELEYFDEYNPTSKAEHIAMDEESLIKTKSRALKIYNNLKKVKQPISPGGRLTNFINSLFTTGKDCAMGLKEPCISTQLAWIVDEDCRPCGHKSLHEEEHASLMSVSVPTTWKIGRPPTRKNEGELKYQVMEKSRRVEEAAREFLKDYHQNQKKNDLIMRDLRFNVNEDEEDDDDAASDSSSDLFELDHLAIMGNGRYHEELPVYETTQVSTNRAIASNLKM